MIKFVKKHKKVLVIFLITIIIISVSLIVFRYFHKTHYKFNDKFIIGNTIDKIESKYGKLIITGTTADADSPINKRGYYIAKKAKYIGYSDLLYWIEFDDDGLAERVYLAERKGG